jgi:hypothetical protein
MVRCSSLGRFAYLAPVCSILLHGVSASAQASAGDKAAAEALFDQGLKLMKQNSFAEACPKLEESDRIDPAVGTLLYLGECYERTGRTASAWATFREAASLANTSNQADRARVASARAQGLESRLSRLSIELAPDVAKIPGIVVKRGGQRLEPSLYGTALPVDPGEYRIEVTAPGYEPWATPVKVEAGGATASVRVPALVPGSSESTTATPAPAGTSNETSTTGKESPSEPVAKVSSAGLSTQQTLGIVVAGVGVAGIGVGSYFGIRAINKNSDAEPHCPNSGTCNDQEGLDLNDQAKDNATIANIGFGVGLGLVAAGAILYFTGGSKDADSVAFIPSVAPGAAGANLVGRF